MKNKIRLHNKIGLLLYHIEQLKWEDRLTEQQKLDKLINELK